MTRGYDRWCDIDAIIAENLLLGGRRIRRQDNKMREAGVEPASPKAPDPKTGCSPLNTSAPQGPNATARHQTTPDSTTSATAGATSLSCSPLLPSPCVNSEGENAQ